MASLHFELVSPARLLYSGEVESVSIPGTEGEMTVLASHAPVLALLKPGIVVVRKGAGADERIFVKGGFAEVNPKGLTVLAETALPVEELNAATIAQQIKDTEEDVADAKSDEARRKASETLEHLKTIQAAL